MKKNVLAIGIVVLFIGMSIIPSTATNVVVNKSSIMSFNGNTLYVGGNGSGNYTTIQSAIDNASDGDTVFVYDDSSPYYECVQINNSIDLIGEDRNTTVIDANRGENVIFIASDEVSIHEFTIQNSKEYGIEIDIYFGFCTISDNIIIDNTNGILMRYSCNNIIEGNTFFDNKHFGLNLFLYSNNNTISGNTFDHSIGTYHHIGIILFKSTGNNISENTIKNNEYGIFLDSSDYNLVLNNIISSNEYDGIAIDEGSNNKIIGNNISYNLYFGISIEEVDSVNNIIYHNNLVYNRENAYDQGNNIWDDGEYGNYWSDYEERYPNAKEIWRKGIWDTPYEIPGGDNKDMCPLIKQWPKSLSKTMPRDKALQSILFLWFLERFPILQKILSFLTI